MSLSLAASMSVFAGNPLTAVTVTDSGRLDPSFAAVAATAS